MRHVIHVRNTIIIVSNAMYIANDLRYSEPKAVADGIANLVLKIEQQCPSIQVAVSGIIVRTDDTSMADRVRETNYMLKSLCNQMTGILYLILMLRPFI